MIETTEKYELAFRSFEDQDPAFRYELENDCHGVPTCDDWDNARRMLVYLRVFYTLTLKISGSLYVTSNRFFEEIFGVHTLLQKMLDVDDPDVRMMALKMKQKFDKYWGDPKKLNPMIYLAVVFDPRQKLKKVQFAISKMYPGEVGHEMGNIVKDLAFSLFNEYKNKLAPEEQSMKGIDENLTTIDVDIGDISRQAWIEMDEVFQKEVGGDGSNESEMEQYLSYVILKNRMDDFDILQWWKINSSRFPILSVMVRDILAIPISTVASESAFSIGGRVLDPFKSSLSPKLTQALLCAQDWLHPSLVPINVEEDLQEIEQIEKGDMLCILLPFNVLSF